MHKNVTLSVAKGLTAEQQDSSPSAQNDIIFVLTPQPSPYFQLCFYAVDHFIGEFRG
jgi:hypothetical protein